MTTTDEPGGSLETVHEAPAEGDDIVILTSEPGDPVGLSRRNIVAGAGIVAILAIVAVVAVAARHSDSTVRVQTSPAATLGSIPVVAKAQPKSQQVKPKGPPVAVQPTPSTAAPTTIAVAVAPVTAAAPTIPPTVATTIAAPKQYGPSALTWDAPHSLTIAAGAAKTLAVTAHNTSDGTVTLPHPLSCAPRLDHGEMCPEMVQLLTPGQSAGAQYSISAKDIAPGRYTLSIEGVLTVPVTVS